MFLTDKIPGCVDRTDEMWGGGGGIHPTRSNVRPHVRLLGHTVTAPPRTTVHGGNHRRWWARDNPLGVLLRQFFHRFHSPAPGPLGLPLISIARSSPFFFRGESFALNLLEPFIEVGHLLSGFCHIGGQLLAFFVQRRIAFLECRRKLSNSLTQLRVQLF